MQAGDRLSLEQMQALLEASDGIGFQGRNREEVYGWVDQTLRQIEFGELPRNGRGIVRRYVEKMTGLSRAQVTRLVAIFQSGEAVKPKAYRRHRFQKRYTGTDGRQPLTGGLTDALRFGGDREDEHASRWQDVRNSGGFVWAHEWVWR